MYAVMRLSRNDSYEFIDMMIKEIEKGRNYLRGNYWWQPEMMSEVLK